MSLTLSDLRGENAHVIVHTIKTLLRRLEREIPEIKGVAESYEQEAKAGNYVNLCNVTERYVLEYLPSTLKAHEGDLTALHDEEQMEYEDV